MWTLVDVVEGFKSIGNNNYYIIQQLQWFKIQ